MKAKLAALLLALLFLLAACVPPPVEETALCNVVLAESEAYTAEEHVKSVPRGEDASFLLHIKNGYRFLGTSYHGSLFDVAEGEDGTSTVALTLSRVRYSAYVDILCEEVGRSVTVTLAPSDNFTCEAPSCTLREGEDAVFVLLFPRGSTFASADYEGSYHADGVDGEPAEDGSRLVTLTLEKVTHSASVTVTAREIADDEEIVLTPQEGAAVIGYALNGGEYTDGRRGTYFTETNRLEHGIHPNTSQGQGIAREGYLLTGWNTRDDGEGTHVGLGSRVTVEKGETILLYAEWTKTSDPALFDYVLIEKGEISTLHAEREDKSGLLARLAESAPAEGLGVVITKVYLSNENELVIPDMVGGYPVIATAPGALTSNLALEKLVLPNTVEYVMERSFAGCTALAEIVLSDNMHYIDYNAFGVNCPVSTIRINAATEPLSGTNESAQLANKLELLGRSGEGPRTVFFGSCATWYGVNAAYFTEQTGRNSYNLAVEGDTGSLFQLDLLAQYLREGDTLVYNGDLGSPYLMMYDLSLDQRAFRMTEFNYDLLATLDMRRYDGVISALNDYLVTKYLLRQSGSHGSYADYLDYMTERGDLGKQRDGPVDDMVMYHPRELSEIVGGEAFRKTEEMIRRFLGMGLDVHYGFGPICADSVLPAVLAQIYEVSDRFDEEFETMSAPLIFSLADVVWPIEDFYDQPYRLDTEASLRYTDLYIEYFLNL